MMITAKYFSPLAIQRAYDRRKWVYSKTIAKVEWPYHQRALQLANIQTGESVLEVAVGPGLTLLELARQVGTGAPIHGVDLSPGMLDMTRLRLGREGFTNVDLRQADARRLPFADAQFDVLYNAYMLDIIPEEDMQPILSEFYRVLKPGGRLVLLNMSKMHIQSQDARERLYKYLPRVLTLYLLGACRPVFMSPTAQSAGFVQVNRVYMAGPAPSEIVTALKPAIHPVSG
jgi:ubiquinone/menaquinone biosynthesis C-methylase UbiE